MTDRAILSLHQALRDDIGDLTTRRPLPGPGLDQVDPFLFLNHHGPQSYPPGNHGLPFGPHPHRGFETVTFILEGELAHLDSGGHESIIRAGGVQWMTAGAGLVHAEVSPEAFKRQGGALEILQLWVNLPARLKMTPPRYTGLQQADLPTLNRDEGRVRVELVAGELDGQAGPVASPSGIFMAVLRFAPGGALRLPVPPGANVFLYAVRGALQVGGQALPEWHLARLGDGDAVSLAAPEGGLALFGHAMPFGEPVVSHGPFVMNTREEILAAIRDYQAGRFGSL
ncbi:pirin family protein [Falsiroseomonas selenitidurans]|uniref:Pirin family protein n=1 Tax=Falsiroseomonas selenitidurans TaxID=2716335 RepID=A0ABX1DX30_9PROT|nr:pirin family protein [Falsiroseomonas selenitidurans]NKC29479.1 pirin family protein [Falsiroseomonas selenitidurans]